MKVRALRYAAAALMSFTFCGCTGSSDIIGGGDPPPPPPPPVRYMTFEVTCGNPARGAVVGVSIFDESTQGRVLRGGTIPDGSFCSLTNMDTSKSYRIEIYELPQNTCVMILENITFVGDPIFWTSTWYGTVPPPATLYLGGELSGWSEASGNWGP